MKFKLYFAVSCQYKTKLHCFQIPKYLRKVSLTKFKEQKKPRESNLKDLGAGLLMQAEGADATLLLGLENHKVQEVSQSF